MPFPRKYTHSGIALTFSKPYSCKGNGGYCKMWCVLKSSFYFFSYRVESMSVLTTKLVGQTLQTLGLFSQCQLNWHSFDEHMKIYWSHNIHTEYTWSSPWYTLLLQGERSTGTLKCFVYSKLCIAMQHLQFCMLYKCNIAILRDFLTNNSLCSDCLTVPQQNSRWRTKSRTKVILRHKFQLVRGTSQSKSHTL